ncbi:hypothetical protein VTH06DRAFT_4912 [Thermothelomyces fergusii]
MDVNNTALSSNSSVSTDCLDCLSELTGWTPTDRTRGSIEILWSCCITILLCCWVSTFPNITSPNDKWYHAFIDKCNLACIGFLGPDYLFAIALGQLSSAWRSVKAFMDLPRVSQGREWTLVHGFFADMGGFTLVSPDYPPFPVNAEQLHYLVKHGHVDFPDITKDDIKAMSKTDSLSKLIVLWQVLWFSASELERARQGFPMTTFELTALSFALTMVVTSLCWYAKPTIARSMTIQTKGGKTIESIRKEARESTHPGLPEEWYRTPLDFISPYRRFILDVHWSYYEQLTYMVHLPFFSRKMTSRPWDRLPSEAYLVIEPALLVPATAVAAGFSLSPLFAWNFHFPTHAERLAWRICSVYHAVFSLLISGYYVWSVLRLERRISENGVAKTALAPRGGERGMSPPAAADGGRDTPGTDSSGGAKPPQQKINVATTPERPVAAAGGTGASSTNDAVTRDLEAGPLGPDQAAAAAAVAVDGKGDRLDRMVRQTAAWLRSWRNISPDGDPDMAIGLRATFFPLVGTFLYIFCRAFFYIEDFIAIREQPVGVYVAMNKFIPFMQ